MPIGKRLEDCRVRLQASLEAESLLMAEKAADPCTACLAMIEQDGPDLYVWPSRPAGSALMAEMKVLGVPSGLCWRHMASNADLEAVTHASRGPYRFRTCRDMLSVGDSLTEEQ